MTRKCGAMAFGLLLLTGCISIPPDVRAELQPPDGRHPNNYGQFVEGPTGKWSVRPDVPTIAPVGSRVVAKDASGGGAAGSGS